MTNEPLFVKQYYADVSKALVCGKKEKRAVLSALKNDVAAYLNENTGVTRDSLLAVFGTPEEIAAGAMQTANPLTLKKKLTFKRMLLVSLLIALLIWAAFAVISLIDVHNEAHGFTQEGILHIAALLREGLPL